MCFWFPCHVDQRPTSKSSTSSRRRGASRTKRRWSAQNDWTSRAVTLMQQQVRQGGEVIQEWPRHNKAWHFRSIRGFWGSLDFHEAQVDGCAYGLTAPKGGLIKKPWRWRSTTKKIWQLQRLCQCQQPHVPCEGGELTRPVSSLSTETVFTGGPTGKAHSP